LSFLWRACSHPSSLSRLHLILLYVHSDLILSFIYLHRCAGLIRQHTLADHKCLFLPQGPCIPQRTPPLSSSPLLGSVFFSLARCRFHTPKARLYTRAPSLSGSSQLLHLLGPHVNLIPEAAAPHNSDSEGVPPFLRFFLSLGLIVSYQSPRCASIPGRPTPNCMSASAVTVA
jgi:hypothetical protein